MSKILYNNKLSEMDSLTIASTLGLVSSANIENLRTRTPAEYFEFINILAGNDITITLEKTSGILTTDAIVIMYTTEGTPYPDKINLFNGATNLGLATPTPIEKRRYIDGEQRNDWIYVYDTTQIIDKVEIIYQSASSIEEKIGQVLVMMSKEIKIDPKSYNDNPIDISNKKRSAGGQIFGTQQPILESFKFTTQEMSYDDVYGLTDSMTWINQTTGITGSLFVILEDNQNMNLYCTLDKLISKKPIISKDADDNWLWQCNFSVTEEL